ncbi:MAG TPA: fibronectin type III domain-containing protein [Terracidiphilus sp.]
MVNCPRYARFLLLIVEMCLCLSVAFASPKVKWATDSFNGTKTAKISLTVFGRPGTQFVNVDLVGLAPSKRYFVRVEYTGVDWLFIPSGDTLYLKADDVLLPLSGTGSSDSRNTFDTDPYGVQKSSKPIHVREVALYEVTLDQIRKIAAADLIQYRLVGKNQTITSGVFKNPEFKTFLEQAIPVIESDPPNSSK